MVSHISKTYIHRQGVKILVPDSMIQLHPMRAALDRTQDSAPILFAGLRILAGSVQCTRATVCGGDVTIPGQVIDWRS